MNEHAHEVTILLAEDDDGHAALITLALRDAGLSNPIRRFCDGEETLDFLFQRGAGAQREEGRFYVLLLDIRMPRVDGLQVLRAVKNDNMLKTLPVIMLTTTDDPREIDACYESGCNCYITKPVEFGAFTESMKRIGLFLRVVRITPCGEPSQANEQYAE